MLVNDAATIAAAQRAIHHTIQGSAIQGSAIDNEPRLRECGCPGFVDREGGRDGAALAARHRRRTAFAESCQLIARRALRASASRSHRRSWLLSLLGSTLMLVNDAGAIAAAQRAIHHTIQGSAIQGSAIGNEPRFRECGCPGFVRGSRPGFARVWVSGVRAKTIRQLTNPAPLRCALSVRPCLP